MTLPALRIRHQLSSYGEWETILENWIEVVSGSFVTNDSLIECRYTHRSVLAAGESESASGFRSKATTPQKERSWSFMDGTPSRTSGVFSKPLPVTSPPRDVA